MKRLFMSIVAVATMILLFVPSFAMAVPNTSGNIKKATYTQEELDARFLKIHSIMRSFVEKKTTDKEVLVELAKIGVHPLGDTSETLKLEPTNNKGISDSITPMSVPDYAINLLKPVVFQDRNGYMYVGANFSWNSAAYWKADFPSPWPSPPYYGVAIGGNDGFGVAMNQPINRISSTFDVYDTDANRTSYTVPSSASQYGIGYTKQDYGSKLSDGTYDYDWNSGYLGMYFSPVTSGRQMSAWSEMGHTWSTSSVSITGISAYGITWSATNYNYFWTGVSPACTFTAY